MSSPRNRDHIYELILCSLIVTWVSSFFLTARAADSSELIAFVNVNVVHPEHSRIDSNQTVIVRGTQIAQIAGVADVSVPADAEVIAGEGRYLMAGLAEMHAHVPKAAQGRAYLEDLLFLWAANGVTTLRNMNGEPAHLELRAQLAQQAVLGPRLYTAGPPFQGSKIKTATEARALVVAQAAAGYDFLKVHMGLPLPIYEAVAAAAIEQGIPFAGHVAEGIGLSRAFAAHQASIDHLDAYMPALVADKADAANLDYGLLGMPYTPFIDDKKIVSVARATRDAGVWNVPTLTLASNFVGPYDPEIELPGMQYMPPRMQHGWSGIAKGFQKSIDDPQMAQAFLSYRLQLVKALHDEGAGLMLGSDAPQVLNVPGFSAHAELALLVTAGLTEAEALTTATVNPAIFLGAQNSFGRVGVGLDADLVLVEANPLEDLSALHTPAGVMLRGRWLSAEEIATGLQRIAAKNAE